MVKYGSEWIVQQRGPRNPVDPVLPYGVYPERERGPAGVEISSATIFLTNRECPWRCLMCDLWKNTLNRTIEEGLIPAQIVHALEQLGTSPFAPFHQVKIYNSGSFFDPRAIPPKDYDAIARHLAGFERVIVECHPALLHQGVAEFHNLLIRHSRKEPALEIAIGLETANEEILLRMNKGITLASFSAGAKFVRDAGMSLRVFLLIQPPFVTSCEEAVANAVESVYFAANAGADPIVLIPTRGGNGALEQLAAEGLFSPPSLETIESAFESCLGKISGRLFLDLWNFEQFCRCSFCRDDRRRRLEEMNRTQEVLPRLECGHCGAR